MTHTSTEQELQKLREELAEEAEAAENWRRLALQFDNHRMQAIGHLKAVTNPSACFDKYKAAKAFLSAPPLGGEEVLAQRIATLAAQTKQAVAAPVVPQGWKPVQIELLERIQESLGSFLSDQGWSQSDMDTADALGGLLAAAPQPAAAPAQEGWCDGCNTDNCVGCGSAAPAQVQPKPNKGEQP